MSNKTEETIYKHVLNELNNNIFREAVKMKVVTEQLLVAYETHNNQIHVQSIE